ncbi:MAG: DNA methyltransferase, partial [Acetobacteraceae bacterium]
KGSKFVDASGDYIVWYAKDAASAKVSPVFAFRAASTIEEQYNMASLDNANYRRLSKAELESPRTIAREWRRFMPSSIYSDSGGQTTRFEYSLEGRSFRVLPGYFWRTPESGMDRLAKASRLAVVGNYLRYRMYAEDYPIVRVTNYWDDVRAGGFGEAKIYVVQTATAVIERCILMATDPGDLVLDPTCGSGTTAYVAEQWGRRWITIDTSRVALALARTRLMAARYPWYQLADSREGRAKEAELTRRVPADTPVHNDLRQGFVYERVPHITLKSIANNPLIDDIWAKWQAVLEPLRTALNAAMGKSSEEWQIPRELPAGAPAAARDAHANWWEARIARQKEIDASIAARAAIEYLYDKPYVDNSRVRVAGPFTVESLSPHRVLPASEEELADDIDAAEGRRAPSDAALAGQDFAAVVIDYLKVEGVRQQARGDRITFESLSPWPGNFIGASGTFIEGENGPERRAAILVGPEYGTVGRQDIVAAAREAVDARFDVLIACAFNFDAHSSELASLGGLRILKARINPDMHMSDELKNTGRGNMFVVFGEPDVEVVSGLWLVTSAGRLVVNHERLAKFSRLGSLEEVNRLGGSDLPCLKRVATGRTVRADQPGAPRGGLRAGEHSRGGGETRDGGVPPVPQRSERFAGGSGDPSDDRGAAEVSPPGSGGQAARAGGGDRPNALGPDEVAALEALNPVDFPLRLTTDHWTQITVHGVDIFDPNTGEIRSNDTAGIAAWFIDTDYNEESFFVRHAYFLGANDPYKSLKTALRAEIDEDAWATLYSDTSRPFARPESGRIAVKVISHFGDEVMKVFRV